MDVNIIDLKDNQIEDIENRLDSYDRNYISYKINANIHIGAQIDGELIGGVIACMTSFKMLYVSTVYIEEVYRRQGIGKLLMTELENRAREIGANMIRLDSFNWQGRDFYLNLGYEQVGYYCNEEDGFSEYFFIKRI